MRERFVFNCILARSRVVDIQGGSVRKLHPDTNYLHGVELVYNYSLWPLEVVVRSSVRDRDKLRYLGVLADDWELVIPMNPNHSSGEKQATLECRKGANGGSELLTTLSTDGGFTDTLGLEVDIE
jgi:hypothetical protein